MTRMASQITSLAIVYSTVYSGADQSKHQSSASLAFVWEIHRGPVNFPHKWPVTRKMFPFDDVIMDNSCILKCEMKLRIHSQTWKMQPSKFENGKVISSHIYRAVGYLSILGLQLIRVNKRGHMMENILGNIAFNTALHQTTHI